MAYKYVNDNGLKAYTKKVKGALKDLHTPIAISTENTTESKAQNVKNIADFVAKAKAAGIADVNGMAVTCLIDDNYSGVGYLTGNPNTPICGLETYDSLEAPAFFSIESDGSYSSCEVLVKGLSDQVTSLILDKGARKPIILTPETTEVDEETYQKLLSDDVDVVFKVSETTLLPPRGRDKSDTQLDFYFSFIDFDEAALDVYDSTIIAALLSIKSSTPHTVSSSVNKKSFDSFLLGYIDTSIAQSLLQEINLTGTDAERKARLDQFEKNWKETLGGVADMTGARFVGKIATDDGTATTGVFSYDDAGTYVGLVCALGFSPYKVEVSAATGDIYIASLFSHLGAIIIKTANTPASKKNNIKNIQDYSTNLENLGVNIDTIQIPVTTDDGSYTGSLYSSYDNGNVGILMKLDGTVTIIFQITENGEYIEQAICATVEDVRDVEILAQAVKAFGAIELKASDNAANKAALTAYRKILTDAGVSTTNGYSVPVRITGNAQEYHGMLNIGTGALLSGIVTDVNENHHYPFNVSTADGVITFDANNYFLEKTSNEVTEMLDAIKYSYTPVPLTATTLSNKAQLEVFLSKVPNAQVMHCTYKDVYAGTLHKINGSWYGVLVGESNTLAGQLSIKLQADGTIVEGTA